MTIQFYLSNIPLPAAAHAAVERKLLSLRRLSRALDKAQVDISRDRHHQRGEVYRVEVNVTPVTGSSVRGVASATTIVGAANEVIEKLTRQLAKKKEKVEPRRRRAE
jgi:ribosomal subunit interface protein